MQQNVSNLRPLGDTGFLIASAVKVLLVFSVLMVIVALLTLLERKVSAWMQDRLGPNRVGPGGLGQPLADGIKNILKEETNPSEANGVFFTLAPMLSIIPALITIAVIPFASPLRLGNTVVPMVVADIPVGVLFLLAFSSLAHPAITMPYTPSDEKARRKSTPTGTSATTIGTTLFPSRSGDAKGITAKVMSAGMMESIGARVKKTPLASAGLVSSLRMFLIPSASGCPSPPGPTRLGPRRSCIHALTLRSRSVRYATMPSSATNTSRTLIVEAIRNPFSASGWSCDTLGCMRGAGL